MAKRKAPDSLGSNTRQMLDELDVLMEKMLSLPVNEIDEASIQPATANAQLAIEEPVQHEHHEQPRAPSRNEPRASPDNAQFLVGQLAVLHSPTGRESPPSPKNGAHEPRRDTAPAAAAATPPRTMAESLPAPDEILPPLARLAVPTASVQLPPSRRIVFRFRPLLWFNQGFDLLTQRLGGIGGWLRSSQGRMVLGMIGLMLLAAAAGWWLKEWMGWSWSSEPLE